MRGRNSRLVNPWGSSRWMSRACSRAWTRGSPKRSPGMRVPLGVRIGVVRSVKAAAPRIGSWLMRWTPCGVPELGHQCCPGLLGGCFVFVDQAAEDRSARDPFR
jgi:hypothetical protein